MINNNLYKVTKLLEKMFVICAAYNLRYCSFYGPINRDDYVTRTVKLLIVFVCFLAANFIVMSTILIRIAFNASHVTMKPICWLRRNCRKETSVHAYKE